MLLFTSEDAFEECMGIYSHNDLVKCEMSILQSLEWIPMVPTCSEIMKALLSFANPAQDFSPIIKDANVYVFEALKGKQPSGFSNFHSDFDTAMLGPSTIAIAALSIALENLGYSNFTE